MRVQDNQLLQTKWLPVSACQYSAIFRLNFTSSRLRDLVPSQLCNPVRMREDQAMDAMKELDTQCRNCVNKNVKLCKKC